MTDPVPRPGSLPPPDAWPAPDASTSPDALADRVVGSGAAVGPADGLIVVDEVSKFFGNVVAVSDVSFSVGPGVTALLGPNGAGKSTLFRMLCGLTPPSRGSMRVLGLNPRTDRDVRGRIGLVPQQDALFDHLSAGEFVTFAAASHGLPDPPSVAADALGMVDLDASDPKPVGAYSKGMRQRVKVATALVNDPEVLILDEVARLGSRILVIAQGRLVATGDYRDLREMMDDRPHRVRIGVSDPRRLASALVDDGLVVGLSLDATHLLVDTLDSDSLGRRLAPIAREMSLHLREVTPLDDDLESVFRYLVDRR